MSNGFADRKTVERLRKQYPVGCRVRLLVMDDIQAPAVGTEGTVRGVDDTGSILVKWDTGSSLNVVYGVDCCMKIEEEDKGKITTICYGQKDTWQSRDEAKAFFLKAIAMSEGSEQQRYAAIYTQLCLGKTECSDEVE